MNSSMLNYCVAWLLGIGAARKTACICELNFTMPRRVALLVTVIALILESKKCDSYKTWKELTSHLDKVKSEDMTSADKLVGVAMDFVYSNQTIMNLLASQLWNAGSVALDKIVKVKGNGIISTYQ